MGYERQSAIIVTGRNNDAVDRAHAEAVRLGMTVTPIVTSPVNYVRTFLVAPDGSKECCPESEEGDRQHDALVAWLNAQRYKNDSSPLDWVEVQYGGEIGRTLIVRHGDNRILGREAGGNVPR